MPGNYNSHYQSSITLSSFAKINLMLHVNGKDRISGYHILQSLVCFVDVADYITVTINNNKISTVYALGEFGGFVDTEKNSLLDAINFVKRRVNIQDNFHVEVKKNIPVYAGMGGGSGNSAALLKFLIHKYRVSLNHDDLMDIPYELGADILPCLQNKPCWVEGVGNVLRPVKMRSLYILLVNPRVPSATKNAFKYGITRNLRPFNLMHDLSNKENLSKFLSRTENSFNDYIFTVFPEVKSIVGALKKTKGVVHSGITGSGNTCFAIYSNTAHLKHAERSIKKIFPSYWVKATKSYS